MYWLQYGFLKRLLAVLALVPPLVLSGCAATQRSQAGDPLPTAANDVKVELYQIYIGSQGELLDPYTRKQVDDERGYLDEIFKNIARVNREQQAQGRGQTTLTIFIHGGLNTFDNATDRVNRVHARMLDEGKYPLFISWDSGFPGNYRDHLFVVRRGIHRPKVGTLTSPIVFMEDLARSVVHIPYALYNVFFGQRSMYHFYTTAEERAAENSRATLDRERNFHLHPLAPDRNNLGHSAVKEGLWLNPVKIATAPLIDGLGKGAWNSMLRRTDLVLHRARDFYGRPIEEVERAQVPKDPCARMHVASTAAAEFFRRWEDGCEQGVDIPAILVAHSMGAIIANNILAKYPKIHYNHIVYMAAAAPLKDVETVVAPYLQAHEQTRFYNLSLHPDREVNEAHYYDVIPRGSLLVWIDDTLADINSFQDRTTGTWHNIMRSANQVFKDEHVRRRVHLTRFGVRDGSPQNHGDFGKCPFWREGFWTFTEYGADRTEELLCNAYFKPPADAGRVARE